MQLIFRYGMCPAHILSNKLSPNCSLKMLSNIREFLLSANIGVETVKKLICSYQTNDLVILSQFIDCDQRAGPAIVLNRLSSKHVICVWYFDDKTCTSFATHYFGTKIEFLPLLYYNNSTNTQS